MDVASSQPVLELENSLALLAVKGTVTAVTAKLNGIRQEKNAEVIRSTYDEIVNELLEERAQAIQIAQALKDELNRVEIDEAGIESLDATIGRVFQILKQFPGLLDNDPEKAASQEVSFNQIRQLISADTLRTMQLLGFNYKAAIGEPLTELCAKKIKQLGDSQNSRKQRRNNG
jgi:hypothetical protein